MTEIPNNIENAINEFKNDINKVLDNRVKKLFFMVHMLEAITGKIQT